jgi:tryptophan 2,3-dioxygenase
VALTDYEKYIRTEELLALQKSPEALTCHDELQFQVVHQAHELYMKLIEHELRFTCRLLDDGAVARAITQLRRVSLVQHVLLHSVELLAHGMKTRFVPELWEVRDALFAEWTRAQAAKGQDTGYHG